MVAHIILITKQYPDPRTMQPYFAGVEATVARYGGGYQCYEQALAWYQSPEYAPLRELRMATGRFDVILVDGISEDDPATTGKLDAWEIERIAELEAEEANAANGLARAPTSG